MSCGVPLQHGSAQRYAQAGAGFQQSWQPTGCERLPAGQVGAEGPIFFYRIEYPVFESVAVWTSVKVSSFESVLRTGQV